MGKLLFRGAGICLAVYDRFSQLRRSIGSGGRDRGSNGGPNATPEGGRFFREDGILFLSQAEVQQFADSMITAQPMLGALRADPSPRGVFDALDLFSQGAIRGRLRPGRWTSHSRRWPGRSTRRSPAVTPRCLQNLLSDRAPSPRELRRFVLARPALNFGAVEPGHVAVAAIQSAARSAGLVPERGVRVRVTGPVALGDDQLAALSDGARATAALSVGLLVLWLYLRCAGPYGPRDPCDPRGGACRLRSVRRRRGRAVQPDFGGLRAPVHRNRNRLWDPVRRSAV